jgi:hypothetical protein
MFVGKTITATATGAGNVTVAHNLGWKPTRAIVVGGNTGTDGGATPLLNHASTDATNIVVNFTAAGTAYIYVG